MTPEFWRERWQEHRIGFHEGKPNELLVKYIQKLEWTKPLRILVPLAGKSFDLRWLADRGHDVIGVELVRQAIDEFFAELGTPPTPHRLGAHDAFYAKGVTLVQANMLQVSKDTLGEFDAVYDRAALVALNPPDRDGYVKLCREMLRPKGGTFLIAFSYDQATRQGPPWSVDDKEVARLFGAAETLESRATNMHETAYWILR